MLSSHICMGPTLVPCACRAQKQALISMQLKLNQFLAAMWVLGIHCESSRKRNSAFNS